MIFPKRYVRRLPALPIERGGVGDAILYLAAMQTCQGQGKYLLGVLVLALRIPTSRLCHFIVAGTRVPRQAGPNHHDFLWSKRQDRFPVIVAGAKDDR